MDEINESLKAYFYHQNSLDNEQHQKEHFQAADKLFSQPTPVPRKKLLLSHTSSSDSSCSKNSSLDEETTSCSGASGSNQSDTQHLLLHSLPRPTIGNSADNNYLVCKSNTNTMLPTTLPRKPRKSPPVNNLYCFINTSYAVSTLNSASNYSSSSQEQLLTNHVIYSNKYMAKKRY